jgi:hypothetical protein
MEVLTDGSLRGRLKRARRERAGGGWSTVLSPSSSSSLSNNMEAKKPIKILVTCKPSINTIIYIRTLRTTILKRIVTTTIVIRTEMLIRTVIRTILKRTVMLIISEITI